MSMTHQDQRESIDQHLDATGKYVRYTGEQVEALERVYAECPKPSSLRRQQLIRECPILSNIEPKQIKVWFQNRRCREKQRKEASRLQTVNRKLSAMNKLLMEENDRLQKQVSHLVCQNGYMKQQLQTVSAATTDASCDSAVTTPQHSLRDANNPAGLLSIAEETLAEFLSKATGTAVDWVQMPGMKPGPDSVGIFTISQSCSGVAARACGLVSLEPTKIAEILKDRQSWFRDCRSLEVFTVFPAGNGGTIELVYTQTYAPTTLAPARDFWTLRYTTSLDNGSIVVCERSLSGSGTGPNAAATSQFVRAEMLPSGYLIRPCEGGGSIIHIVDHLNLEAWSVPEVLKSLYESSKVVAQKMTISALRYIRQIAQETSGEVVYGLGRQPAVLRTFSQRLNRGFNDAINGFTDDGWSVMNCDGAEDVIIAVNSSKNFSSTTNPVATIGGALCAKASMLLQNVPPAVLVRFLREHRSEWADFNVDAYSAASLKAGTYAYPGMRPTRFTGSQIIMPLGHTIEHEELLEVIRLEGHSLAQEDAFVSRDIHLLQICTGVDENSVGACSELVFAPIDEMFPDDGPLLPSGFRIIPLESKSSDAQDIHRTLDLTSSLEVGPATNNSAGDSFAHNARSVLTIAFQFPFETSLQENVANMARQYVRSVISSVQRVAMAISPSGSTPAVGPRLSPGSPEALTLSTWICQSYSYYIGTNLLRSESSDLLAGDSVLKHLWQHQDAILCCSLKSLPVFVFANQAGLDMLETTLVALPQHTMADSAASQSHPLRGRVTIVTGASRGIGRAIALHLASLGANLVVNYTSNSAQADLVAAEINSSATAGSRAVACRADVSDPDQVKALFDRAEETFKSPVHILVNSAGVLDDKYPSIANTTIEDFDKTFSVNARGAFVCCREAANRLKRGGGGRIIILSSSQVASLRTGFGAYTASKAAVEALVKILAKELKGTGITANCVAPGPIATDMFFAGKSEEQVKRIVEECPLGRLGESSDVTPVVGFLATDASEWVNGQIIRVNGGCV